MERIKIPATADKNIAANGLFQIFSSPLRLVKCGGAALTVGRVRAVFIRSLAGQYAGSPKFSIWQCSALARGFNVGFLLSRLRPAQV